MGALDRHLISGDGALFTDFHTFSFSANDAI